MQNERSPNQVSFKISQGSNRLDESRDPSPLKQRPQKMPSNDIINLELMHNFGGNELSQNQKTSYPNPFEGNNKLQ